MFLFYCYASPFLLFFCSSEWLSQDVFICFLNAIDHGDTHSEFLSLFLIYLFISALNFSSHSCTPLAFSLYRYPILLFYCYRLLHLFFLIPHYLLRCSFSASISSYLHLFPYISSLRQASRQMHCKFFSTFIHLLHPLYRLPLSPLATSINFAVGSRVMVLAMLSYG